MAHAEVVLELSGREAGVLLRILERVGGDPAGPRGAADSIRNALKRLGVAPVGKEGEGRASGFSFGKDWD